MDLEELIREAELNLFLMSGSGLGALFLTVIALAIVLCSRRGYSLNALIKHLRKPNQRTD